MSKPAAHACFCQLLLTLGALHDNAIGDYFWAKNEGVCSLFMRKTCISILTLIEDSACKQLQC